MSAAGGTGLPQQSSNGAGHATAASTDVGNSSLPQLEQPEGLGSLGSDLTQEGNRILAEMEERVKEKQSVVESKANELQELEQRLQAAEQRKAELEAQAQGTV